MRVKKSESVDWISISEDRPPPPASLAEVPGWQISMNEISNKLTFTLKEIHVQIISKHQCWKHRQTPVICTIFLTCTQNLGPVSTMYILKNLLEQIKLFFLSKQLCLNKLI